MQDKPASIHYDNTFYSDENTDSCHPSLYFTQDGPVLEFDTGFGEARMTLDMIRSEIADPNNQVGTCTVWITTEWDSDGAFYSVPIEFFHQVLQDIDENSR